MAKQVRVKDTRSAMVARFSGGTFIYPAARFAPTETERGARRNPGSMFGASDDDSGPDDTGTVLNGDDDPVMLDEDDTSETETAAVSGIPISSAPGVQVAA